MCASREDLINIGGADEHVDYLGHVCGPYEMTFRLVNYGRKEVWHQDEWLYHTWHPGESGRGNYMGPNDGRNVSATALDILKSSRIMPLVENPAIRKLRLSKGKPEGVGPPLSEAVPHCEIAGWTVKRARWSSTRNRIADFTVRVREWAVEKRRQNLLFRLASEPLCHPVLSLKTIAVGLGLVGEALKGRLSAVKRCHECLKKLALHGVEEVAVYGESDIARMICVLSWRMPVRIRAVYDGTGGKRLLAMRTLRIEELDGYEGRVVIGSFARAEERRKKLAEIGIGEGNIVVL